MKSPHVLWIMTDQQRADCLGAAGHPILRTPHLDRLSSQAVRFSNGFTVAPLCVPARNSQVTGQYPHNTQVWQNDAQLFNESETFLHRLGAEGYRNACIGKLHLCLEWGIDTNTLKDFVASVGFEDMVHVLGVWSGINGRCAYTDYLEQQGLREQFKQYYLDLHEKDEQIRRFTAEAAPVAAEHVEDAFVGRSAMEYVQRYNDSRPSFLMVSFAGPHEPWDAPDPYATMYDPRKVPAPIPEEASGDWLSAAAREYHGFAQYFKQPDSGAIRQVAANYFGKITLIDDWVGKILDAYQQKGWLDETLVIFSSDHGEMLGDHNRLSKGVFYDSALRIPLIVKMPQNASAGRVSAAMVENIDLPATILDVVGCEPLAHADGISLLPAIRGQGIDIRTDILSEVHEHTMLRTDSWKIVVDSSGQTLQLFDLEHDPLEQVNLAGQGAHQQAEDAMRDRLLRKLLDTQARRGQWEPGRSVVLPLREN